MNTVQVTANVSDGMPAAVIAPHAIRVHSRLRLRLLLALISSKLVDAPQ